MYVMGLVCKEIIFHFSCWSSSLFSLSKCPHPIQTCPYRHIPLESIAMPSLKGLYSAEDPLHQHIVLSCQRCSEGVVIYARNCSSTHRQGERLWDVWLVPITPTVGLSPKVLPSSMDGRPTWNF